MSLFVPKDRKQSSTIMLHLLFCSPFSIQFQPFVSQRQYQVIQTAMSSGRYLTPAPFRIPCTRQIHIEICTVKFADSFLPPILIADRIDPAFVNSCIFSLAQYCMDIFHVADQMGAVKHTLYGIISFRPKRRKVYFRCMGGAGTARLKSHNRRGQCDTTINFEDRGFNQSQGVVILNI